MKLFLIFAFTLLVILCSCQTKREEILERISNEEYESLMNLDYQAFDQAQGEGWRKYHDDMELQLQLILDYMERNNSDERILKWHVGQIYAMLNQYQEAIPYLEQCIYEYDDNIYHQAWNFYARGTIAFLKKDLEEFNVYYDSLLNHSETMNLNVMQGLKDNFDKPYKDAY